MAYRKYTSWDEAEFRAQRRVYRSKKNEPKKRKKEIYTSAMALKDMEDELRMRFIVSEHTGKGSADKSVKALKQFCNFLGKKAEKNTAGGARFKNRWKDKNMHEESVLISSIIAPVNSITYMLNNETVDYQILLDIKNYVLDIQDNLAKTILGLMEIPFYNEDSGFMNGAGHNVAFKDVMIQLLIDANNNVYSDLADRIESIVSEGKDIFSYRLS